ncbi:hypothetical protein ACA910_002604 [Epithemia clementina (nom. ined.)]
MIAWFEERDGDEPMVQLYQGASSIRIKATDPNLPKDCIWMIEEVYTELYGLSFNSNRSNKRKGLEDNRQGGFTWTTKRPGGFSDDHIAIFDGHILDVVSVVRYRISKGNCESLLRAYLGPNAGSRVNAGDIRRGEGLVIRSVVWFSDIRGFTRMSCHLTRTEVIDVINGVFEASNTVIQNHGGQILKFMGDGVMAIFSDVNHGFKRGSMTASQKTDLDESHGAILCHRAQKAACELHERLGQLRKEREAKGLHGVSIGIGLHYGDVSYGNVGAADRLDFTVIGKAVNLASGIENLCSKLGANVLASAQFVELLAMSECWKKRGDYEMKGIDEPVCVYEFCGTQ